MVYPILCPECEQHIIGPYEHKETCDNWGKSRHEWILSDDEDRVLGNIIKHIEENKEEYIDVGKTR